MRNKCLADYTLPPELKRCNAPLEEPSAFSFDVDSCRKILAAYDISQFVFVTLLSAEYLGVGAIWLMYARRIPGLQYIVLAMDYESEQFLCGQKALYVRARIDENCIKQTFISKTGFTAKGIAVVACKYPFVHYLLTQGYSVALTDIDALILKQPVVAEMLDADIAFQRVLHFPSLIASIWGFAACSGYVCFRSSPITVQVVRTAMEIQVATYSDQIALNVALWEAGVHWRQPEMFRPSPQMQDFSKRKRWFQQCASEHIYGTNECGDLKVLALSADRFWRNDVVPFRLSDIVVFHPNSLKNEQDKIDVFRKYGMVKRQHHEI